ncbi:MAG: hypothetical protein JSS59_11155 [Proteobacteria bacterium]|uniref:leucine-rich repeat domain-containing protein n=1 Tax=Rudaea sp. TaxID=2136325 RepID=UPI00378458DB|nr:hypothetical protein [Pseudomonadota bacterium]
MDYITMSDCMRRGMVSVCRGILRGAFLLVAAMAAMPAQAAVAPAERNALIDLYNATQGPQWINRAGWLAAAGTECFWSGVTCDPGQTTVVGLNLTNNQLQGTLPALAALTNLVYVDISQNALTGSIPSLAGLTKLQVFNAYGNQLSGTLPALTGLTTLQQFRVWGNQLTGSLPSLSDTTNLVYFDASNNQLTGTIPAITQLAALEQFIVSNNQLSGAMPSLSGLAKLRKLDISYNQLSGAVSDLGTNSALQTFYIDHNNLSGALPTPPGSLAVATVCPNVQLSHTSNASWDLATGQSPWYQNCGLASQLVITDINGGVSPAVGAKFPVTVALKDGTGASAISNTSITVQLSVAQGSGTLLFLASGAKSCTILVGASGCTVSNVSYSAVESQVRIKAATYYTAPPLIPAISNAFAVVAGSYTVGGTVSGLAGPGLVLRMAPEAQTVTVNANGAFVFPIPLGDGADYQVDVTSQPGSPPQSCTTSTGSGTIVGSSVTSVQVTCKTYYSLFIQVGSNAQISGSPTQLVLSGTTGYFHVFPKSGYRIDSVSGRGCSVSVSSGDVTTSPLTSDCVVTVTLAALDYIPMPYGPKRVLDTRAGGSTADGSYAGQGPLAANTPFALPILGRSGIPTTGVGALVLNVLATNTSAPGYITVWPSCVTRPLASNLNFIGQQTVANLVIVPAGCDATTNLVSSSGPTDMVVDVVGYFTTGPTLTSLAPSRLLDTRAGAWTIDGKAAGSGAVSGGDQLNLQVTGRAGIPAGASAAALNVTATGTTAPAFITVWPTDQARPLASNLNFVANQTIPNMVIAKLSATGQISLFNSAGSTDLVADVVGWFPASSDLIPLVPARLLDTRPGSSTIDGQYAGQGAIAAGQSKYVSFLGRGGVPQQGVGAVILNVTAANPQAAGYLTINGGSAAPVQNVNFVAGQTVPNLVIVPADVYSYIYASATTDVVIDVVGWLRGQ